MSRKLTTKQIAKLNDARINALYCQRCSGVQINVMDIGRVFKVANQAIVQQPDIDDADLGDEIVAFVNTIRCN